MNIVATEQELAAAERWAAEAFGCTGGHVDPARFPISFQYGGQEAASLAGSWPASATPATSGAGKVQRTLTLTDPQTGLECRVEVTTFAGYAAVEWLAYLKNTGAVDTPTIAGIQALDAVFPGDQGPAWVHHAKGSQCRYDDFQPLKTLLRRGEEVRVATIGGRSSDGALPFFNLQPGDAGVIGAIGWTGDWAATFRHEGSGVRARAGMQRTHLVLHPGEEIRTPRILLMFWRGDQPAGKPADKPGFFETSGLSAVRAHNLWRRLILGHHTPRPGGQPVQLPIGDGAYGARTADVQVAKARWLVENDVPVECLWIDAGWYGEHPLDGSVDGWPTQVGSWYPIRAAYPDGLKPVGDALRALGLGFILWFEPERVYRGTQLEREHPEWLLGPIGNNYLLDLGNPAARRYVTDMVSDTITAASVTWYRQDFNFQPTPYWQAADAPDRAGITEIRHVEGLYAFWDELVARHPGLLIDNCAGGGQRIDLETISRSVPLWRSDVQCDANFDPIAMQTQTQGLAPWVPLSGSSSLRSDAYAYRSALAPGIYQGWNIMALEQGVDLTLEQIRLRIAELKRMRPYFYGDFYPLVSFSLAQDAWAAWQFDRPDLGEGMVLALRRPQSPFPRLEAPLHGLDADAWYEWQAVDGGAVTRVSGRDLLEKGVSIDITDKPGSALYVYKQCSPKSWA
jgi:alpha-galactosidase